MKTRKRTEQWNFPPKPKSTVGSNNIPKANNIGTVSNIHFNEYFAGPVERIEHDLNLEHVTDERYRSAQKFIHACEKVGVWRLMEGELSGEAGHNIDLLAHEIAYSIRLLIERGDLMLARRLPPIVEILQSAMQPFGWKITGSVKKRLSIEQILKKHQARDLLEMLSALHPDWHLFALPIYCQRLKLLLSKEKCDDIRLRKRLKIESFSEEKLRGFLLRKEHWIHISNGKRTEEILKNGLAEILENVFAVREGENENINLFVEHLWRGRLWGGPGPTFVKCDWHGKKDLPARNNVRAWMKIVMPFLRRETQDDAMKLGVFDHLLAARRYVYHDASGKGYGRLAKDSPKQVWNQVRTEISKAWRDMAKRAIKPHSAEMT